MNQSTVHQHCNAARRSNSLRGGAGDGATTCPISTMTDTSVLSKYPAAGFWLLLHCISCFVCLVLGFRFSRIFLFLLLSSNSSYSSSFSSTTSTNLPRDLLQPPPPPPPPEQNQNLNNNSSSRVMVGRHGIQIRSWPHPFPDEIARAQRILARVQREQRAAYGVRNPRQILAITPTYVRTFQTLHLTGVIHSLMLLPYDLTWIVVEAGGAATEETAAILARSKLRTVHLPFHAAMPIEWAARRRVEDRMRLQALRFIREKRMDGIVAFVDDSNVHSTEFFNEIQSVEWMGALSLGILPHSGHAEATETLAEANLAALDDTPLPIQGPSCNSSGELIGWHTFEALNYQMNRASYVGDSGFVLPMDLEWAGFVMNARILWKDAEDRPDWILDMDSIEDDNGEATKNPLMIVKDASFIEPLGNCGKKIMLWWLRVEARADSKFPRGWTLDSPLEITVPWKRTPWRERSRVGPDGLMPRSTSKKRISRRKRRREENSLA